MIVYAKHTTTDGIAYLYGYEKEECTGDVKVVKVGDNVWRRK